MCFIAIVFFFILLNAPSLHALPLAGGPHDRSSDPAYTASGIKGVCDECHIAHYSPELAQYKRDLSPDAAVLSDLCLDCHDGTPPPWASTARDQSVAEGSLHDFSSRTIGFGGVCWPCHDLHLPDENTVSMAGSSSGNYFADHLLWKRDLTGDLAGYYQKRDLATDSYPSGGPNYLVGKTIFCYDCHGGDARVGGPTDNDFTNPPQDIAFAYDQDTDPNSDGSNLGYYELPSGRKPGTTNNAPSLPSVRDSYENPDNVPGGHYVKTWMNDGATDDNYEVRAPSGKLLYRISIADKLPCELCHDPHKGEITTSDDEVFFRRDIFVGEGSGGAGLVVDRSSESFWSSKKLQASPETRNGQGNGRLMCIYCHGTSDWDENLSYSTGVSPLIVDWTRKTTIYGIRIRYPKDRVDWKEQKMSRSFPLPPVDAHLLDPGVPGAGDDPPCQNCHQHNNAMSANCAGCHKYGSTLPGAHTKHVSNGLTCDVCHGVGAELGQQPGHSFAAIPIDADKITLLGSSGYEASWGARPSWFGSTWGGPGISGDTEVTYTTLNDFACVNVRCHGLEGGESVPWNGLAGSPTYNSICFDCHNISPASFQLPGGSFFQASNAAANYVGPISGFSRGGHGDSTINDPAWFTDSAPGTSVPLACVACHDESQGHFPVESGNPYRVSDAALNNSLPGRSSAEGPLTNLCTQTDCHPKVLGGGDYGFLTDTIKHPSDHFPISNPAAVLMDYPAAAINLESPSSTTTPAYDPQWRSIPVDLHIDRYVDHWGYWGAVACTSDGSDDDPFMPLGDPLIRQVGENFDNYDGGTPSEKYQLVTCVTCHSPHGTDLYVSGQGCGQASTLTSIPDNNMLRLREQDDELCMGCH
ncbi:MAG: hypothetical protein P1S46_00585 [bacterium]|nr:hypothetical protein [bacterium]